MWELAANAEAARAAGVHASPVLFCAFCDGGFDADELQFFLYCRQTLLVQLGVAFLPAATLTRRQAEATLRALFGPRAAGSVLYAALAHLCADFFARRSSLEAFTFLKARLGFAKPLRPVHLSRAAPRRQMLLAAYHDSRPQPDALPVAVAVRTASPAEAPQTVRTGAPELPPAARNSYVLDMSAAHIDAAAALGRLSIGEAGDAAEVSLLAAAPGPVSGSTACNAAEVSSLRELVRGALRDNVEAYADVLSAAVRDCGDGTPGAAARDAVVCRVTEVAGAALEGALDSAAGLAQGQHSSAAAHDPEGVALSAAVRRLLLAASQGDVHVSLDDADALCQRVLTSAVVRNLEPELLDVLLRELPGVYPSCGGSAGAAAERA